MNTESSEIAVVQYNYPEITIVSCLKTLTQDSFFKYEIGNEGVGFQMPKNQIILDNVVYVPRYLYLFRESCVIENERMVVSPGIKSSDPLLFIIPLQSSWFVGKTELDPLLSGLGGGMTFPSIHVENMIANNQPCSVAGNRVVLSVPVSVPFVFPPNMATINALGGNGGFSKVKNGIATILQKSSPNQAKNSSTKIEDYDKKKKNKTKIEQNQYLRKPIIEGLTTTKCTAADPSGANIAEIAMMPVDGDALTGIYTASMTRMLNDFFLFICAVAFSYFFVVRAYVYLVIGGVDSIVKPGNSPDDNKNKYRVLNLFNWVIIISCVLLSFGLVYQANHGPNGYVNKDELTVGILFFIIFGISLCMIMMEISLKTKEFPFLEEGWNQMNSVQLNALTPNRLYQSAMMNLLKIFLSTLVMCAVILIVFKVFPNKKLNDLVIGWNNIGFLLGTICFGSCGLISTISTLTMIIFKKGGGESGSSDEDTTT